MTSLARIIALGWLGIMPVFAQNIPDEPLADPVADAIRQFNERKQGKENENEVNVVLDPPATTSPAIASPLSQPVLVTGKPPESVELLEENDTVESQPADAAVDGPEPPSTEEDGLSVDVQKLQSGKGMIQTGEVKLHAPFPAKPLSTVPTGWKVDPSADVPPFQKEVELAPGKKITLTIRPHLLIPDADGSSSFSIKETGYNSSLGYRQTTTVGAILSRSIRNLEEESKQMGTAIDNLQQLIVSLPNPENPSVPSVPQKK